MTREPSGTPNSFHFPKSARILKTSDFRKVYDAGVRMSGPYFAAFCLALSRESDQGPRIGFTVPRAFGKAVQRNRAKRRIREAIRPRLAEFGPQWDVVINPRRPALDASPLDLQREIDRLISRCRMP